MVILYCFLFCLRFILFLITRENEKWLKERGGIVVNNNQYKWFNLLYFSFILFLVAEEMMGKQVGIQFNYYVFILLSVFQLIRLWCMHTLGKFWTTKNIVIPHVLIIKRGIYKYMNNPHAWIVFGELILIPLLFKAIITAITFPVLYLLLLIIFLSPKEEVPVT